jgi:hypothetical protein
MANPVQPGFAEESPLKAIYNRGLWYASKASLGLLSETRTLISDEFPFF